MLKKRCAAWLQHFAIKNSWLSTETGRRTNWIEWDRAVFAYCERKASAHGNMSTVWDAERARDCGILWTEGRSFGHVDRNSFVWGIIINASIAKSNNVSILAPGWRHTVCHRLHSAVYFTCTTAPNRPTFPNAFVPSFLFFSGREMCSFVPLYVYSAMFVL